MEDEQQLHLVLIEDDRVYARLVEEMVRDAFPGQDVRVAAFGTLADAAGAGAEPDCALVDLSLPDGQGLGVLETVQAAMPNAPLVVLTGAEDEELALQAVEAGAQDYLVKRRVDPEVLRRSIRYAMERMRAERQRAELLHARAAHAEAEALSGTLARLQDVADAAMTIDGGRLDRDALLERSLKVIAADAGVLVVQEGERGRPEVAASRGLPGLVPGVALHLTGALGVALAADDPLVLHNVAPGDAGVLAGVASLAVAPLDGGGRRIGALVATSALPQRFSDEQAGLLALAAERCGRAIAHEDAVRRERRTSAALQTGLLPQAVPDLSHGEIAVRYLPARGGPAVGGDWYDAIVLPDGRLGLAIGDVTGHGPRAAVLMGQLRTALRAYALEGTPPAQVVARLNALALSLGDAAMATLVYAVLDEGLGSGTYVTAGHLPPIVVSADGAAQLPSTGSPATGMSASVEFLQRELTLAPGDALCLYSDGLVEERGTDLLERERMLLDSLGRPADAEILCERALAALRPAGAGDDDVALLVLRTTARAQGLTTTRPATPDALREIRGEVREWLTEIGAEPADISEILHACNEACMNVVEHAYDGSHGEMTVEGYLDGRTVVMIVRDDGRWSEVQSRGRGRGLKMMEALMDSVQLSFSADGTMVVLRKALSAPPG